MLLRQFVFGSLVLGAGTYFLRGPIPFWLCMLGAYIFGAICVLGRAISERWRS